jgi:hypothetical protein
MNHWAFIAWAYGVALLGISLEIYFLWKRTRETKT